MIIDYKTQGEWQIQLTMSINFISSIDSDETRNLHTKSYNAEIMMGNETYDTIEELLEFSLPKYQEGLEESMKGSEFIFGCVDLLYYNLQKTTPTRKISSYIDSREWLKNKKANINPKDNDDKCFQYALTVALNYQNIKKDLQRIHNLSISIIGKRNFLSEQKDCQKCELNNKPIAHNILFVPYNTEK